MASGPAGGAGGAVGVGAPSFPGHWQRAAQPAWPFVPRECQLALPGRGRGQGPVPALRALRTGTRLQAGRWPACGGRTFSAGGTCGWLPCTAHAAGEGAGEACEQDAVARAQAPRQRRGSSVGGRGGASPRQRSVPMANPRGSPRRLLWVPELVSRPHPLTCYWPHWPPHYH